MSSSFNWLHLTDLHLGLAGQQSLWPNLRATFFDDLRMLHERSGPWNAVLFTGDFVQHGSSDEFKRLDTEVLGPLWDVLQTLGSGDAKLLTVPGNHDLVRPAVNRKPTPPEKFLLKPELFTEIAEDFWNDSRGEYRKVVDDAFVNFVAWRDACPFGRPANLRDGLLPGDFTTSLETTDAHRVGILGLNTTFLQLAAGDYTGKLASDVLQFQIACGGDGPGWVDEHDVCLLLTHQGPEWFDALSRDEMYPEINPAGRFAVHLFGHMHENVVRSTSTGGGKPLRLWQGNSLFSMEQWGNPPKTERRHGYAGGRIEFNGHAAELRHWPRKATYNKTNGWRFVPDIVGCLLRESDSGTEPESIALRPRRKPSTPPVGSGGLTRRQTQLVDAYRQAALKMVDIVDLANLPEDDRHIAMQRFVLRQLYIPLRLTVDAPVEDELDEVALIAWEKRRERDRLLAAGRQERGSNQPRGDTSAARSVGELLTGVPELGANPPRLVILGDPGGGKTTLLRWLATAWLLKAERPEDVGKLPGAESLPASEQLPILVRCRQLDTVRMGDCTLADILLQTLRPMELKLSESDTAGLIEALLQQLDAGRAVLLVDGLDEIADPQVRSRFCERLETIAQQYSNAPLLTTSRIVGYREMPKRLGRGFRHATLVELSPNDKDDFVRRWCETVERDPGRRLDEQAKLLAGIHDSTRRIERLTSNPMLLTTMALVQRKVGRLPAKRYKLYEEAVGVLLNWRSEVDPPLDADEALPQLEYVAWAMCDRGLQRLRRDQVLALLESVRQEYPHIRAVAQRTPEEFLKQVESRTSLLVEVGSVRHDGLETPVYEFRHLTIQEYLAAVALIRGHFPGHNPAKSLAERIAPLAGKIEKATSGTEFGPPDFGESEFQESQVTENWREVLRLCVAACNDDDVDSVLRAILDLDLVSAPLAQVGASHVQDGQLRKGLHQETRARAILAALCLADEPNASQGVAEEVFGRFVSSVDGNDGQSSRPRTGLDRAVFEVATSVWAESLEHALVDEFLRRGPADRFAAGALSGSVTLHAATASFARHDSTLAMPNSGDKPVSAAWMQGQVERLSSADDNTAVAAALAVVIAAFEGTAQLVPGLTDGLLSLAVRGPAAAAAACWAMGWLTLSPRVTARWQPSALELDQIVRLLPSGLANSTSEALTAPPLSDANALRWLAKIAKSTCSPAFVPGLLTLLVHEDARTRIPGIEALGSIKDPTAVAPLICLVTHDDADTRTAAIQALGGIKDRGAVAPLIGLLVHEDADTRMAASQALGRIEDPVAVAPLISLLAHEDPDTRTAAIEALVSIKSRGAVAPLIGLLAHEDADTRIAAIGALGSIKDRSAVAALIGLLTHEDAETRTWAIEALGNIKDPSAVGSLLNLLVREDARTRKLAVGALSRIRDNEIDIKLLSQYLDGASPWIDPLEPIDAKRLLRAATELELSVDKISRRYQVLAKDYGLKIEPMP